MPHLQPWLHDLTVALAAPTVVLSGADGQIRPGGVQGVLHSDIRVLSRAELCVAGEEPVALSGGLEDAGTARFTAIARSLGDPGPDPTVRVERIRRVVPGGVEEEIRVLSYASVPVETEAVLAVGADVSAIEQVKSGKPATDVDIETIDGSRLRWSSNGVSVLLSAEGGGATPGVAVAVADVRGAAELRWPLRIPPRGNTVLRWTIRARVEGAPVRGATNAAGFWRQARISGDDRRLAAWTQGSVDDLRALLMAPETQPNDVFAAAGAPWYFTLFGRDSIWTARLMLPFGWELAAGTLRALAAHQGAKFDSETMEAPGKIPHELRRGASVHESAAGGTGMAPMSLPPLYYGTIDATPLWVCLLHDAWRAGMPMELVRELIPQLRAAMTWVVTYGDEDGDGFLEYLDRSGRGLSNQGWKDSGDSIRFRDGRQARGPVALCEAQGYAHEAALGAASMYEAFGLDGADALRTWAAQLAERFRERFWVHDADGPYPALALDGEKKTVDSSTSNMGHLLGTGLLDAEQSAAVVARLTSSSLDSGFGLRTMARDNGGYSPFSYHCGTVWPHDTAIVIWSMARAGFADRATGLARGLLEAAAGYGSRLPELYSGDGPEEGPCPAPYPAACRPQAWAAAAVGAVVHCLLGLRADLPNGTLRVSPLAEQPFGALHVSGLRAGSDEFGVEVGSDGSVRLFGAPASVRVGDDGSDD